MQPLATEVFVPFSHLLLMMMIIVIMATTKAAGAAELSRNVAAKSTLMPSAWFRVLYSKSEMKITQRVNRKYQNHLCSSLDLSYILLFLFSTYDLSFVKYHSDSSVLDSYRI